VFAVGGDRKAAALLWLQIMHLHQTAKLLAVHHHALMAQGRAP
jgi:hypothetical protein